MLAGITEGEQNTLLKIRENRLEHRGKPRRNKTGMRYRGRWDIYADILKYMTQSAVCTIRMIQKYGSYSDGGFSKMKEWITDMQYYGLVEVEIIRHGIRGSNKLPEGLSLHDIGFQSVKYPMTLLRLTEKGRMYLRYYIEMQDLLRE